MNATLAAISAALTLALTGAMAGLFYAFSISVMRGLDGIDGRSAIAAMQSINRKILNPVFLATFMLAPVAALATGGLLLALDERWAAVLFGLAAATYVLGAVVPTIVVNVPMNEALDVASVPANTNDAARMWTDYSGRWTRWNTLRAVFSAISLLLVGLAIFAWGRQW
ncbi:MAG: DUF1772 domain-containing protein [Thermomicrobiales bacterium]